MAKPKAITNKKLKEIYAKHDLNPKKQLKFLDDLHELLKKEEELTSSENPSLHLRESIHQALEKWIIESRDTWSNKTSELDEEGFEEIERLFDQTKLWRELADLR